MLFKRCAIPSTRKLNRRIKKINKIRTNYLDYCDVITEDANNFTAEMMRVHDQMIDAIKLSREVEKSFDKVYKKFNLDIDDDEDETEDSNDVEFDEDDEEDWDPSELTEEEAAEIFSNAFQEYLDDEENEEEDDDLDEDEDEEEDDEPSNPRAVKMTDEQFIDFVTSKGDPMEKLNQIREENEMKKKEDKPVVKHPKVKVTSTKNKKKVDVIYDESNLTEEDLKLMDHETSGDKYEEEVIMKKYFTDKDCDVIEGTSEVQKVFGEFTNKGVELTDPEGYFVTTLSHLGYKDKVMEGDEVITHNFTNGKTSVSFMVNRKNTNILSIEYKLYPKYFPHKNTDTELIKAFNFCYATWAKKWKESYGSRTEIYYLWENHGNYALGNLEYDTKEKYAAFRLIDCGKEKVEEMTQNQKDGNPWKGIID